MKPIQLIAGLFIAAGIFEIIGGRLIKNATAQAGDAIKLGVKEAGAEARSVVKATSDAFIAAVAGREVSDIWK